MTESELLLKFCALGASSLRGHKDWECKVCSVKPQPLRHTLNRIVLRETTGR